MEDYKGLYEGLCATCSKSIFCRTWTNWKCLEHKKCYPYAGVKECEDYKKRPVKWAVMPCRCEDCLKNELLADEIEED